MTFVKTIQSLLSYTQVSQGDCGVRSVQTRTMDIVEDRMSSSFLAANYKSTYIRYNRVGKMIIKHQCVLSLLVTLSIDAPAGKTFRITHHDDPSLYISSKDDILVMVQATDSFTRNDHKPP